MHSRVANRARLVLVLLAAVATAPHAALAAENLFVNPSFEMGRAGWQMDKCDGTQARFTLDTADAAAGQHSALLSVEQPQGWGIQFGQTMDAGQKGKTYTFAVVAKAVQGPVQLQPQIERAARPYDRAAASEKSTVSPGSWRELHVTFTLKKDFSPRWFAYVSCAQPQARFRLDMFRLYEGDYVPYEKVAREEAAAAAVKLFDTGGGAFGAVPPRALVEQTGWKQVPEDQAGYRFRGSAVLMNDRLALVLRPGAPAVELHARGKQASDFRAQLAPLPYAEDARLESVAVVEKGPSETSVDVLFRSPGGKPLGLRLELTMGQQFVKSEAREATTGLGVRAPCRWLVLPDFFADDIVVDAAGIPVATAELPSENFLLHLLPGGNAMVMEVASSRAQDARITLDGAGDARTMGRSEMAYGKDGKIWVAVLEGRNIWHAQDVKKTDAGQVLPMDWRSPFPAQWRVDYRLANGLCSSWEMLSENRDGSFQKEGLLGEPDSIPASRSRWNTVLGRFPYPCWIDRQGGGYLQPLTRVLRCEGPALVYPLCRTRGTPLTEFAVGDLVRRTLGVGPCEYILDVEGQGSTMKGRATCATRDALGAIYSQNQQLQKQAEIEKILQDVVIFVTHIRSRIEEYAQFGRDLQAYLEAQRKARPEASAFIDEMQVLARTIEENYQKRKAPIKTPQYVIDLTNQFRAEVMHQEGPEALRKCVAITKAIVVVGGNQDELVGESRLAVKNLRQRAGLAMATQPQAAEIAREIRSRTQKVLRNAASYEAPRH